ncbi:MAG: amino acid permease [bacterium]
MKLKKELGLAHIFSIATGSMIGAELFVLPGLVHAKAGPAAILCFALAGLLAMTGMFSIAELATAMPKAGGDYFFVTRGLGPAAGTIAGLLSWFSLSIKSAFALLGMAIFIAPLLGVDVRIISLLLCLFFILVNLIGVREAGRLQAALVFGLLGLMALYIIRGLPAVKVQHFEPFAPFGLGVIFSSTGFVFLSYGGLLKVVSVAEEIKKPRRDIPQGMIISLLVVNACYTLAVFVTIGILDAATLGSSLVPISEGAGAIMGEFGRIALNTAAVLACATTANAGIMSAARYLLALSRDGLLPELFEKINPRFHTPHSAILITGGLVMASLFLKLDVLVEAGSAILILTYILANLSIIIIKEGRMQNYQPSFHTPLYPWMQIAGLVGFILLLFEMGARALITTIILMVSGFFTYWFYGHIRADKEYALLHLIERITAKELASGSLEFELREIIRERDNIVMDRFDRVIENSFVLDMDQAMNMEECMRLTAETMATRLKIDPSVLSRLLINRERESSTAISPGLAIPHIVIEGEHTFDILLARSRKGVTFSASIPKIHAIFVLAGTKDERNFYLRALSAIAQIVQDPQFEKKWLAAKGKQGLRDLVLLGERRRFQQNMEQ